MVLFTLSMTVKSYRDLPATTATIHDESRIVLVYLSNRRLVSSGLILVQYQVDRFFTVTCEPVTKFACNHLNLSTFQ